MVNIHQYWESNVPWGCGSFDEHVVFDETAQFLNPFADKVMFYAGETSFNCALVGVTGGMVHEV